MTDCADYLYGNGDYPTKYKVCIPVQKGTANAVTIPSSSGISVPYHSEQSQHFKAILALKKEINQQNLTIDGELFGLGIVAPYTGRAINSDKYCTRYFIPIKK